jgi:Lon protease-like protein
MSHSEKIEIPLFPLPNVVLFPGAMLPLHIFEERYKTMINTCIEEDAPFGMVLFDGGQETTSSIRKVGVLARVAEVERLDDGRMNVITEGEVRFRISQYTSRAPAWRAEVNLVDDRPESDSVLSTLASELGQLYLEAYHTGLELTGEGPGEIELPTSASELSFMVPYVLDMDTDAKQELLETTSVEDRLRTLIDYLKEANERLTAQVRQKRVSETARGNGDLGHPQSPS